MVPLFKATILEKEEEAIGYYIKTLDGRHLICALRFSSDTGIEAVCYSSYEEVEENTLMISLDNGHEWFTMPGLLSAIDYVKSDRILRKFLLKPLTKS